VQGCRGKKFLGEEGGLAGMFGHIMGYSTPTKRMIDVGNCVPKSKGHIA